MLVLEGAAVIDGTGAEPGPARVLIERERIVAVGTEIAVPESAQRLDLTRHHLLPGLIDLHSHSALVEENRPAACLPALLAARMFENAELSLAAGYTTMREVGRADGGLVQAIESGLVNGPRYSLPVLSSARAGGTAISPPPGRWPARSTEPGDSTSGLDRSPRQSTARTRCARPCAMPSTGAPRRSRCASAEASSRWPTSSPTHSSPSPRCRPPSKRLTHAAPT